MKAPPWLVDLAVAAVVTGVEIGLLLDGSAHISDDANIVLTVLAGLFLVGRRRAPLTVLVATAVVSAVVVALDGDPGGALVLVALFTVAERRSNAFSVPSMLATALWLQAGSISSPPVTLGAWAAGAYWQTRQRYLASLVQRADHLEREREQLDLIAAQRERAAIARELHDVVAHSVTVMLVGVRGARDVLRTAPDVAEETLAGVERGGEQSIAELRRILTVLRDQQEGGAVLRPVPALAQLEELVGDFRRAGVGAELSVDGTPYELPVGVQVSVYRVVEEGLTNVLKHAGPVAVSVALRFAPEELQVELLNDGPLVSGSGSGSRSDTDTGHGLIGMRERVLALGGRLETGPRPDGGFRVAMTVPVDVAAEPVPA